LIELPAKRLRELARSLSGKELAALADYLRGLTGPARQRVLNAVADDPAKMRLLAAGRVRDGVVSSRDQAAALAMMLRSEGPFDLLWLERDVRLALAGKVAPMLIWVKHPQAVIAGGILALIVLMILNRLLFGGRRRRRRRENQTA